MLDFIKDKIFNRYIKSKNYGQKKHRKTQNWKEIKTIGFLIDGSDPIQLRLLLNRLYEYTAQGKKIEFLGYVKKFPPFEEENIKWITRRDLSWSGIPKPQSIKEFIEKEFDVLINTHIKSARPLEFIAACSNAKLRIGVYAEKNTPCYDFMMQLTDDADAYMYMDQVEHYLKMIN